MRQRILLGLGLLVVIAYLLAQSYSGRESTVRSTRAGCVRGMGDRFSSMESWYAAYLARIAQARLSHGSVRTIYRNSALTYLAGVKDDMTRVDRSYSLVWPDPRVVRLRRYQHPLGYGRFSCYRVFPDASLLPSWSSLGL